MTVTEIAVELSRLLRLEVDSVAAYGAAVAAVEPGQLQQELTLFQLEHERHALWLHDLFLQLRLNPPEAEPGVKGPVIGALTPPRALLTVEELLEAVRGNERLCSSIYAKVLARPLPDAIREVIARARDEERHHLEWVERALSRRAWRRAAPAHP
jgi:hypothetical protein